MPLDFVVYLTFINEELATLWTVGFKDPKKFVQRMKEAKAATAPVTTATVDHSRRHPHMRKETT